MKKDRLGKSILSSKERFADTFNHLLFHTKVVRPEKLTLVLYYGEEEWNGSRNLVEFLDISDEYKPFVQNYSMNLIEVNRIDNLDEFTTDMKLFFGVHKYRRDKEKMRRFLEDEKKELEHVDIEMARELAAVMNEKELDLILNEYEDGQSGGEGKETVNMCQAFKEMLQDERMEGMEQITRLNRRLVELGRTDDLIRSTLDGEYQKQLLREFQELPEYREVHV